MKNFAYTQLETVWKNIPPAFHHQCSSEYHCVTFTILANYFFSEITSKNLEELWLELVLYCDVYFDLVLHRISVKHNTPCSRLDIVDVTGLKIKHFGFKTISLLKKMGALSQQYPEMIGATITCNVSKVGLQIWNMVKGWLPKQTESKMKLFTADYLSFLKKLNVVPSLLPSRLNGSCTCSLCTHYIDKSLLEVCIPAGTLYSSKKIQCQKGDLLCWEIYENSANLPFWLTYSVSPEENESSTRESNLSVTPMEVKGSQRCRSSGSVYLEISNEKSWLHSQNVIYALYLEVNYNNISSYEQK
jgi:hypothetical protein